MKAFKHTRGGEHFLIKREGKPTLHILAQGTHVHINTVNWDPEEEEVPQTTPCDLHEALTTLEIAYELLDIHTLLTGGDNATS